jgi:hypothetical protein
MYAIIWFLHSPAMTVAKITHKVRMHGKDDVRRKRTYRSGPEGMTPYLAEPL